MSGRAILYLRVSSGRQVDNTSLKGQETVCRKWCRDNGLVVDRIFIEKGESAKTADRTEFQAMFRYLSEARRGSITHLGVYKFDRFSRSIDEGAPYRLALRKMGVSLSSATEPTDDTPAGRFLSSMLLVVGELDNDMRAERSTSGMKARLASGRWQWCPPTGYLKGSKSGASLIIDSKQGPFVRRLFEMVASGETRGEALAKLTAQGFRSRRGGKLNQEAIRRLLASPVYVGQVVGKSWGIVTEGDFEPLIDQKTFDKVQRVLAGKSPVAVPHARDREEFSLRGLLLCPDCMKPVTASTSRGQYGQRHRYYRCHRVKGHVNAKADVIEAEFLVLMGRLAPSPERMALLGDVFRQVWEGRTEGARSDAEELRRELGKLESRKARMLGQLADGFVSGADYARMNRETSATISEVQERLEVAEMNELDIDSFLSYLEHLLWNSRNVWESSDLQGKQRLQRRIFPKGLVMGKTGFGTPVTHSIFMYLGDDSVGESEMVRPRRFELLTYSFGGCRSLFTGCVPELDFTKHAKNLQESRT